MRILVVFLILIFGLQSFTKADDIRDFQIEGISVGDNLLDYFNVNILKDKTKIWNYPKSSKFTLFYNKSSPEYNYVNYSAIQIHYKTKSPNKYKIYSIQGQIHYFDDIKNCYPKKREIYKNIKNLFPNIKPADEKVKHDLDNKSLVDRSFFRLSNGTVSIACTDWKGKYHDEFGDKLTLSINSYEFNDWVNTEAY